MNDFKEYHLSGGSDINPDKRQTLEEAQKALDRFLTEHPELKSFQAEIDRRLKNAGNAANRLGVLCLMIEGKLRDLQDHMSNFVSEGKH